MDDWNVGSKPNVKNNSTAPSKQEIAGFSGWWESVKMAPSRNRGFGGTGEVQE